MKKFLVAGMVVAAMAFAPKAEAALITGSISFGGDGNPIGSSTWYQSTGVDFDSPWIVVTDSGAYEPASEGITQATFTALNWTGASGDVSIPIGPQTVWTFMVGGLTYSLTVGTIEDIDRGDAGNDNIAVVGTGTLTITGPGSTWDPTPGTFSFTGGFDANGAQNLSFSSSAQLVPQVPEPGSMLLLGTGLIGLAAAARRRMHKA